MNIDERLDKLTARHEALTQSVELLTADVHEMRIEMRENGIRTDARIEALSAKTDARFDRLAGIVTTLVEAMVGLDGRVSRLEQDR